jgi:hypothetical protein
MLHDPDASLMVAEVDPKDAVNSASGCLNRLKFSIHYFLQLVIGNVRERET